MLYKCGYQCCINLHLPAQSFETYFNDQCSFTAYAAESMGIGGNSCSSGLINSRHCSSTWSHRLQTGVEMTDTARTVCSLQLSGGKQTKTVSPVISLISQSSVYFFFVLTSPPLVTNGNCKWARFNCILGWHRLALYLRALNELNFEGTTSEEFSQAVSLWKKIKNKKK